MRKRFLSAFAVCVTAWLAMTPRLGAQPQAEDGVGLLLDQVKQALVAGDAAGYLDLLSPLADRDKALEFVSQRMGQPVDSVVVRERDREPLAGTLPGDGYSLMVDIFEQMGSRGRVATWRLDVRRMTSSFAGAVPRSNAEWDIVDQDQVSVVEGLYRLALDPRKQYRVQNLVVRSEDLVLRMPEGSAFTAATDVGVTAIVLLGRGQMLFSPAPESERDQVRILSGQEKLETDFDWAVIRLHPADASARLSSVDALVERPVDAGDFRRADRVFKENVDRAFSLDLEDLSPDTWSIIPAMGDFLAEIATRRFDTLTYARSAGEDEDISLFERKRHRNIAVYTSAEKLKVRGRFYDEDASADFDVLDYNLNASFVPDREWVSGVARLKLAVRADFLTSLTVRLAEPLKVTSVWADQLGRLMPIRVRGQNSILLNMPNVLTKGYELVLNVAYEGTLSPESMDVEPRSAAGRTPRILEESPIVPPEPRYLYSNRSYWYPQAGTSDYATATLRLAVPPDYGCVASGEPLGSPVLLAPDGETRQGPRRLFVFRASVPLRYLSCVISRFDQVASGTVALSSSSTGVEVNDSDEDSRLLVSVEANPRQVSRARELSESLERIVRFYGSILGDVPYPSLTLAVLESDLPGGHSPAYVTLVNQPLPTTPFVWRNDPVSFDTVFPHFFLAHEIAHQWWGQAVGWKNYHEQWLSEGFAQYFAALYTREVGGEPSFTAVLKQMRRTSLDQSSQGPLYLGYRLGHIKGDSRVFRALVYNKGALVLHMLRRLVGERVFFAALRNFYERWAYKKAGSDDLRQVFEAESGLSLSRFFEQWVYGSQIPTLKFSYRKVDGADPTPATGQEAGPGQEIVLRFEQVGELFDVPVTVKLTYSNGESSEVVVRIAERVTQIQLPLAGPLRSVDVNQDEGALAEIKT